MIRLLLKSLPILMLLGFVGPVAAQTLACQRISQQLAGLSPEDADPSRAAALNRQIQAQRAEAARIATYMRSIGCNQPNLQFSNDASPECVPLNQRLRAIQQMIAQLNQQALQANRANAAARRQVLLDTYEAYGCTDAIYDGDAASSPDIRPNRDRFFDPATQRRRSGVTIGTPDAQLVPPSPGDTDDFGSSVQIGNQADTGVSQPQQRGFGGRQPVCVRLCDGFFFPLSGASGPAEAQDICQAQCPQNKTSVFFRIPGAEIGEAVDSEGRSYASLPTALRYRTRTDETCTCRRGNQSWGSALQPAEELIEKKNDDLVVTEKNADDIAKGKLKPPGSDPKGAQRREAARAGSDKASSEAKLLNDTPLRTEARSNVRIIDTGKARAP